MKGKQELPSYEEAEVYFRKCKNMSQGTLVKLSTGCSRKPKLSEKRPELRSKRKGS